MGYEVTIGGDRLGSGKKMKGYIPGYERSTHDLSFKWRSSASAGTLIPFMSKVALPGDTFDITLDCVIDTLPTIGPLYGSYKIELDIFQIPIRLYQPKLQMNLTKIGMEMEKVHLPQLNFVGNLLDLSAPMDNQHTNPSSLLSYLGIRGAGYSAEATVERLFNAVPTLGYWDAVKCYYANKQEEIGAVIHVNGGEALTISAATIHNPAIPDSLISLTIAPPIPDPLVYQDIFMGPETTITIQSAGITENTTPDKFFLEVQYPGGTGYWPLTFLFQNWSILPGLDSMVGTVPLYPFLNETTGFAYITYTDTLIPGQPDTPQITTFPLSNIDDMRLAIMTHIADTPYLITSASPTPYGPLLGNVTGDTSKKNILYSQEGLALKTYQSDLFNNWLQTEWIDGAGGIAEITAISTAGGSFTIDQLNLNEKLYDLYNRIAVSDGTYDSWLDAVYTHDRQRQATSPMYLGGLIKELAFEEVVSNSQTENQPLGTLAGRGQVTGKRKGGQVVARISEPSYLMGIFSLTPRIDYSQGNSWDVNLKTMNDLHKPALDNIGYQDLITDQMAWWDTEMGADPATPTFKSAGKQPAWINYMTSINETKGNFADPLKDMFMTLNRKYTVGETDGVPNIKDLTTYIDPSKYNNIFAATNLDAQNFWVQIQVGIEARRKMSAKIIPNL